MSRQSRLSINDIMDNEVKQGAFNKSPGIYLKVEVTRGKQHLGDRLIKAVRPVRVF